MKVIDKKLLKHLDWLTIIVVLALFTIGIISIASIMASPFTGEEQSISDYMQKLNFDYVERQIVNFLVGLAALIIVVVIDYHVFKKAANVLYVCIVALLAFLILMGKTTRGVAGWLLLENIDRAIQPAELCKVVLIVLFGKIIAAAIEKEGRISRPRDIMLILGACAIPSVLVFWQPDFGTGFVFLCILVVMLFAARIPWKYILPTIAVVGVATPLIYSYLFTQEQKNRIAVFLNPELDPLGAGYNVKQSKLSIGSGMVTGKGYFTAGTMAQLKYVPERQTDFIFSGIAEAIGFVGGTIIILLYFILVFRWLYIAIKSNDPFGMCLAVGASAMLLAHTVENIGMTMGLLPVTGIPLPFISYGGSNLLTSMICVGIVLNVYMRRPLRR